MKNKEAVNLKKAAAITVTIFNNLRHEIKPGKTEREIAGKIEEKIKALGLRRSFKTIVASGPNAAHPHAKITDRKIRPNDLVVVDFGVIYKGSHSDLTRTIPVGKQSALKNRLRKAVEQAQEIAIREMVPGLKISEYVRSVHDHMRSRGFGKYILHSLGHGVGKRIHQAPKLSEKNKRRLKDNITVTIEPGLYIKGMCGVRIEDMIQIRNKKITVITR